MLFVSVLAWMLIGHIFWIKDGVVSLAHVSWREDDIPKWFLILWEMATMPLYWLAGPLLLIGPIFGVETYIRTALEWCRPAALHWGIGLCRWALRG